jgi:serine/threonine-protein kinase ATR
MIHSIDPELLSRRAFECKQYARAIYHLEAHITRKKKEAMNDPDEAERLMQSLLGAYLEIDDPDGIDGILANVQFVTVEQKNLSHKKAGRWTDAQLWYEHCVAKDPQDFDARLDLLNCLKQSGQHGKSSRSTGWHVVEDSCAKIHKQMSS